MSTAYIGIDPASSCGWAVLDESGNRIASGIWSLHRAKTDGLGMRYVRFERLLRELVSSYPDCVVGYEAVRPYGSTQAIQVLVGIVTRLFSTLDELNIPYVAVTPATLKRTATGKGNANKLDVLNAANSKWDLNLTVNDESDALWVAEVVRSGLV